MPENITELSAIAIIFIFFLKEFFAFLKVKKNGNHSDNNYLVNRELVSINQKLDNHITHINDGIQDIKIDMGIVKQDIINIKVKIK